MHPRSATRLLAAAALVAVTAAPAAAAAPPDHPLNPLCQVQADVLLPGQNIVCETEAEAGANATVGGYDGPCAQEYPGSELCDDTTVGARVHVDGAGGALVCVTVDHAAEECFPRFVTPAGLP